MGSLFKGCTSFKLCMKHSVLNSATILSSFHKCLDNDVDGRDDGELDQNLWLSLCRTIPRWDLVLEIQGSSYGTGQTQTEAEFTQGASTNLDFTNYEKN